MPRNSTTGTYTLPVAPFVAGTVISPTDVNNDFADIAAALNQSISINGAGQAVVNGTTYQPVAAAASCRLSLSGTNLLLSPFGGNNLTINGVPQQIPSGGVLLGASNTAATFVYIYAYMNANAMSMEMSTTGYTTGLGGIQQKVGDATRTLVGAAYTDTGGAWAFSAGKLWVLSYYNRQPKGFKTTIVASLNIAAPSAGQPGGNVYIEVDSGMRNQFISWADSGIVKSYTTLNLTPSATRNGFLAQLNLDGTVPLSTGAWGASTVAEDATTYISLSTQTNYAATLLTENVVHYINTFVRQQNAYLNSYVCSLAATAAEATSIYVEVFG